MDPYVIKFHIYPVNCEWSSYGNWSECSVTCGNGQKRSNRTILKPALHGGIDCEGNSSKVEKCISEACIGMHFINQYHKKYTLKNCPVNFLFHNDTPLYF